MKNYITTLLALLVLAAGSASGFPIKEVDLMMGKDGEFEQYATLYGRHHTKINDKRWERIREYNSSDPDEEISAEDRAMIRNIRGPGKMRAINKLKKNRPSMDKIRAKTLKGWQILGSPGHAVYDALDLDSNGVVSDAEFAVEVGLLLNEFLDGDDWIFEVPEPEGEGEAVPYVGETLNRYMLRGVFDALDADGDGLVTRAELIK